MIYVKGYHLDILTAKPFGLSPANTKLSIVIVILIFLAACLAASGGLLVFLRIHPRIGLLDVPNERSSHTRPVPRGGGIVVVSVIILLYFLVSLIYGRVPDFTFILTGLLIAVVSLVDDFSSISLLPRLVTHVIAASILVWFNGGFAGINVGSLGVHLLFGPVGPIVSVLFIVWMINAYNFMDGVDGILGAQCVVAGAGWAAAGLVFGSFNLVLLGTAIAGACLGFLFFNWQPARVFMGDVGSTFLGFALASAPLISIEAGGQDSATGLLLSVCFSTLFLFDTLYTRAILILKGSKFWLPHREHLYQRLVRSGVSHRAVSAYFAAAGGAVAAVGLLAALIGGPFTAVSIGVAAIACLLLFIWAGKKHIDVNIG